MNKVTFDINNESFIINLDEEFDNQLKESLEQSLDLDKNIPTKDLLLAYIHKSQKLIALENGIQNELIKIVNILKQDFSPILCSKCSN